jgi:hypothetical protein
MKQANNTMEVSAEMWLNYLYPELIDQWISRNKGSFYRNYNEDAMEVNAESHIVKLSRDGLLRMLPEGMLTHEDELRGASKEKYEEMERRLRLLNDAFLPFDTYYFRMGLRIERQISELLESKLEFILSNYFGCNINAEENLYVKEAMSLLPYVCSYKGDVRFVRRLLSNILNCKVVMKRGRYSTGENTRSWLPSIIYGLIIPQLTSEKYNKIREEIEPLCRFVKEWFMPFDVHCEIVIKEVNVDERPGGRLILGYNSRFKLQPETTTIIKN